MNWIVRLNSPAEKFLSRPGSPLSREEVFALLYAAIQKFTGENVVVDVKKMRGEWEGFYRIRKGKLRIIAEFDFKRSVVFVEDIGWRGGVYK